MNDNDPVFEKPKYFKAMPDLQKPNSSVIQMVATDPDNGGRLSYEILTGNIDNAFVVERYTGAFLTRNTVRKLRLFILNYVKLYQIQR